MNTIFSGDFEAEMVRDRSVIPCVVVWEVLGNAEHGTTSDGIYPGMHSTGEIIIDQDKTIPFSTHTRLLADTYNIDLLKGDFGNRLTMKDDNACREFLEFLKKHDGRVEKLSIRMPEKETRAKRTIQPVRRSIVALKEFFWDRVLVPAISIAIGAILASNWEKISNSLKLPF